MTANLAPWQVPGSDPAWKGVLTRSPGSVTGDRPESWQIESSYPVHGPLRLYRLTSAVVFHCHRCGVDKKSRLAATVFDDWTRLLCDGCYGYAAAAVDESATATTKTATTSDDGEPATSRAVGPRSVPDPGKVRPGVRRHWRGGIPDPHDYIVLAGMLRARAEGFRLGPDESRVIDAIASQPALAVALQFAEATVDGEAVMAASMGEPFAHLNNLRDELARQRAETVQAYRRRCNERWDAPQQTEPFAAMVLREICGGEFEELTTRLRADRRALPEGIDPPAADYWTWLAEAEPNVSEELPDDVRELRQLSDQEFLETLLAECRCEAPNLPLGHHAVAERRAVLSKAAIALLLSERDDAAEAVKTNPTGSSKGRRRVNRLKAAALHFARACALGMEADLSRLELRQRVLAVYRGSAYQDLLTSRLNEAMSHFESISPELTSSVYEACAEHRISCPEGKPAATCQGCVSAVVEQLARHSSEPLSETAEERLVGPEDEGEHAWWLPASAKRSTAWRTALYQVHIDGGWCPLPDGSIPRASEGGPLTIRMQGQLGELLSQQSVTLRRRGGQWEISGLRWPGFLRPGVIVVFEWLHQTSVVTARTVRIAQPVRIEQTVFEHEFDHQVVTRELVPGADQDRAVPDLSDASWVMRTVRRLGYLSADGAAVLAIEDLVRNCLELGMPRSMVERVPRAVSKLCDSGLLQRVEGSRDDGGRPWLPARNGQAKVALLRYVPRVHLVDTSTYATSGHSVFESRSRHQVTGFVRRLPDGAQPSDEQVALHREAAIAAGVVRRRLPDGYTFVRQHHRGVDNGRR